MQMSRVRSLMVCGLALAGLMLVSLKSADARPPYQAEFGKTYPKVEAAAKEAKCAVCHIGKPADKTWNDYGVAMGKALEGKKNVKDKDEIAQTLKKIEGEKGSNGKTFRELIEEGKLPGTAAE